MAARCRLGSLPSDEIALLDTGATWSVIDDELSALLDADLGKPIETISLSIRFGVLKGTLSRLTITLLTEPDWGTDLIVDATVAVIPDWPGPIVLGYQGFFERLRFALDPGDTSGRELILFGGL